MKQTLVFNLKNADGTVVGEKKRFKSLEDFFINHLGFSESELPELETYPRIIRPYFVVTTPYIDLVLFEVDFSKDPKKEAIGLMVKRFEKSGGAALVRVLEEDRESFVFAEQHRFLLGRMLEAVRGFDPAKSEIMEELELQEEPREKRLGDIHINTGISMTKSKEGNVPISLFDLTVNPGKGKGEATEKITGVKIKSRAEVREMLINGELTDPFFALGLLNLWAKERPEIWSDGDDAVTINI